LGVTSGRPGLFLMADDEDSITVIAEAHRLAVDAVHAVAGGVRVGATLSLQHAVAEPRGETQAEAFDERVIRRFLREPGSVGDFVGVQNYTRYGSSAIAQLAVGGAAFWIAAAESSGERLVPRVVGDATGRTLLVVENSDAVFARAVAAGATVRAAVSVEHGWRVGRITDPFGHEWEIGRPVMPCAPGDTGPR
jgi:PhnB protein